MVLDLEWLPLAVVKFYQIVVQKAEKGYQHRYSMAPSASEQKKDSKSKKIEKITKRDDFVRASKSDFIKSKSLIIQFFNRKDDSPPRYGVTASKRIGNAIKRNKAKRRIRHLVKDLLPKYGKNGYDYVFIAREELIHNSWESILQEVEIILRDFNNE